MRFVLVSLVLVVPVILATQANALCNRKTGGQCVDATLASGWNGDCSLRCIKTMVPIGDSGQEKEVQILYAPDATSADIPNEIDLRKNQQ